MCHPDDFGVTEALTQSRDSRKCVHDIAQRTQPYYGETRLSHAAPCEPFPEGRAWSDLWDLQRWRREYQDEPLWPAREQYLRGSRCPSRARLAARPPAKLQRVVR